MEAIQPRVVHAYRQRAPKKVPCPHCGTLARRKQKLHRTVRGIAYQRILIVHVVTAEYRARCSCCRTFRTQVADIEPKAKYTNSVREAVLDRLLEDHMSLERIQAALRRDFFLELSAGFVYDCLRWKLQQLDHADYRNWTLAKFSGTLSIDEIHLGRYTLLLATDPLSDFPVAFALVSHNDQDHMGRFLRQLRDHGFHPRVVITDGSGLYPALLAQIWPAVEHQLCIFHVLQDINACVLDAVRRLRKQWARQAGRRRQRRGRPRDGAASRRRRAVKEKSLFIFRHRYLIVTRREHLTPRQRRDLITLLEYLPALRRLRRFVDQVHKLFERAQTLEQARQRYHDLLGQPDYAADPDLARALAMLTADKFEKMIAFLRSPVGLRLRTNNHVERTNRQLRHYEKVRYRWRRARTIVGFVLLSVHRSWHRRQHRFQLWQPPPNTPAPRATARHPPQRRPIPADKPRRAVA